MAAELKHLLGRELPQMALTVLGEYPNRGTLAELAADGMRLCFLDIGSDQATAFAVMPLFGSVCPGVPLFALLPSNDPDLILQCLRQGASEFLIQPLTEDQFRSALAKLSRFQPSRVAEPESTTKVYCVMPCKGACGATTVACHLAYSLKRQESGKVLLADLDGLTGTLAFLLKLKSNYSFVDALTHAGNLDADVWRALVTPTQGIDVMLCPEDPVNGIGDTSNPAPILNYSRRAYGTVVVDCGGAYGEWNLSLARLCDELLLVTTNELAALHSAQRVRAYLKDNGVDLSKTRLIVNRYSQEVGFDRESIETALRSEVFDTLPGDYEAIQKSLMEGKPVPAGSRFGKSIARLAEQLGGRQKVETKGSLFSGLFRKRAG